jgi:asparagine synthase (glutamine-hydrolysing)
MCGILGTLNYNFPLQPLLTRQLSRGPDAAGVVSLHLNNGQLLQLGHNRLKIIDLSDAANQPLHDGPHYLVFNGEIYNYLEIQQELQGLGIIFQTNSDTEVLLQSLKFWGMKALSKLNGMFAFAYFDANKQSLYLVRDRFGVKPLFYYFNGQQLMFASTSAVIADTLKLPVNYDYLKKGMQYGIFEDGTEVSAYQGLKSLPAGHFLQIDFANGNRVQEHMYYQFSQQVQALQAELQGLNPNALQNKVAETLFAASSQRLKADVPIAIALSGGLDSSAVAVLAKQAHGSIRAFCFGDANDKSSEGALAQKLADKQGLQIHFVMPKQRDWEAAFWQTLEHQDAPFAGISVVAQYLLYEKIKEQKVKVVLGGQGGDEAFLGYRKFQLFHLKELMERKKWFAAAQFFPVFAQMLWAERARIMKFWTLRHKYNRPEGLQTSLVLPGEPVRLQFGFHDNMRIRQISDILQYSLPTLLRYEDRNSMAHSIESRLPFMDYRLLELGCALPTSMNIRKGYGKWVIRALMKDKLPNEIRLARYKRGFDVTQSQMVMNSLYPSIRKRLIEKKSYFQSILPNTNLEDYFNPLALHRSQRCFTELMVLLWLGSKT